MLTKLYYKDTQKPVYDIPAKIWTAVKDVHLMLSQHNEEFTWKPNIILVPPGHTLAENGAEILGLRVVVTDQVQGLTLAVTST